MKSVKKLFTLFILLISSAILFSYQSFSKRLTRRHFKNIVRVNNPSTVQNDDNDDDDEQNDDDDKIEKDSDPQEDNDVDDITAEEEREDEFLMLKIIFFFVFVILILLSVSLCIYLLGNENNENNEEILWKFSQSSEDRYKIDLNFFPDFRQDNQILPRVELEYLKTKKEQFKKRDCDFYLKINKFLHSFNLNDNENDEFYFFLLKVIVPEYSDQRGFPSFFEKYNGRLKFGHSLINNKKNKLYQMTEDGGSLFEKMSTFLEEILEKKEGKQDVLDWFINQLAENLRVNSYLNFDDYFRFEKKEIADDDLEKYVGDYNMRFDYKNDEIALKCETIPGVVRNKLLNNNDKDDDDDKEDGNKEDGGKEENIGKEKRGVASQMLFEKTYENEIASDIKKLIYFLFCRCFMNIVMQKKYSIKQFLGLWYCLCPKEDNNINNINNNDDNEEEEKNDNEDIYFFYLMPRKSSTYNREEVWKKKLLGKKNENGENLHYGIKIKKETVRSYLSKFVVFICSFIAKKGYDQQSEKKEEQDIKNKGESKSKLSFKDNQLQNDDHRHPSGGEVKKK